MIYGFIIRIGSRFFINIFVGEEIVSGLSQNVVALYQKLQAHSSLSSFDLDGHAYIDASPSWREAHVCSGIFTDKKCNKNCVCIGFENRVRDFFFRESKAFVAVIGGYEVNTSVVQHMKIPPAGSNLLVILVNG